MTTWMILFAVFAGCFFVVAAVVTVRGWADLLDLLGSLRRVPPEESPSHSDR